MYEMSVVHQRQIITKTTIKWKSKKKKKQREYTSIRFLAFKGCLIH